MIATNPGRNCPLHYRYGAEALNRPAQARVETLLVAGGVYGNVDAMRAILARYRAERDQAERPVKLIFNGDFHWFDVEPSAFAEINAAIATHEAIQGNVEAELAEASGAGCGCAYPDYVDCDTVARSNQIMERLRRAATSVPGSDKLFARLPMYRLFDVGRSRVAVIHGDPESLAGWAMAAESLAPADEALRAALGCEDAPLTSPDQVRRYFERAGVSVFASTHTCLPVVQGYRWASGSGVVINNGSAGMPNFRGESDGLISRISLRPSDDARYRLELDGLYCEAVPVRYNHNAWLQRFTDWWPAESPARLAYHGRIAEGPGFELAQANRGFVTV